MFAYDDSPLRHYWAEVWRNATVAEEHLKPIDPDSLLENRGEPIWRTVHEHPSTLATYAHSPSMMTEELGEGLLDLPPPARDYTMPPVDADLERSVSIVELLN